MSRHRSSSRSTWLILSTVLGLMMALAVPAEADHTANAGSVTIAWFVPGRTGLFR